MESPIHSLYAAFAEKDGKAMAACYAEDAHFEDPVFTDLNGPEVGGMWRMLCDRSKDLRIESSGLSVDGAMGKAHWEAWYTFSATGKKVHNVIDAQFELEGDLIKRHVDTFSFWRWSRQALGAPGLFLGWSGGVKGKVQKEAAKGLMLYMKRHRIGTDKKD